MVDVREGDCLDFMLRCAGSIMNKIGLVVKCHVWTILEQSHFGWISSIILTSNDDDAFLTEALHQHHWSHSLQAIPASPPTFAASP